MLEEIMRELTETFTTIKCRDIDRILAKTGKINAQKSGNAQDNACYAG